MKTLIQELHEAVRRYARNRKTIVRIDAITHEMRLADGTKVVVPDSNVYEPGCTVEERDELLESFAKGKPACVSFYIQAEYKPGQDLEEFTKTLASRAMREAADLGLHMCDLLEPWRK